MTNTLHPNMIGLRKCLHEFVLLCVYVEEVPNTLILCEYRRLQDHVENPLDVYCAISIHINTQGIIYLNNSHTYQQYIYVYTIVKVNIIYNMYKCPCQCTHNVCVCVIYNT